MPAKNVLKVYVEGGYYHLYNRGVEKRKVFLDERDYKVFLHFLKAYLSPGDTGKLLGFSSRTLESLAKEIQLLAYCLMPNHFHLLVRQVTSEGIVKLMRRVCTQYVMYFNKRYERVGCLFQGRYKAVLVENENQLLHLSRYLHINPWETLASEDKKLIDYSYSSYAEYLGKRNTSWLYPEEILSYFKTAQKDQSLKEDYLSYEGFVENYLREDGHKEVEEVIKDLLLE